MEMHECKIRNNVLSWHQYKPEFAISPLCSTGNSKDTKMRIGIYYHADMEKNTGGGVVFQETLIEEISRFGTRHEVFLIGPTIPSEPPAGMRFIHLNEPRPSRLAKALTGLKRVITNSVLSDEYFSEPGLLDRAAHEYQIDLLWFIALETEKVVTIPYIATVWDLAHKIYPYFPEVSFTAWPWGARERHFRNLLPRAACIITGTKAGKEEIVKFYQVPEQNVEVVPFPTPHFALSPPVTDAQHAEIARMPENYLFYPAQFWPHKNHVGLLIALKLLRDKFGLDFAIVFTGSNKGNLGYIQKTAKELGLAEKVFFPGFVATDTLCNLYRNAFALVYPTFFGPDNLPPLEAFALGCPVIASNVSGAEEQLGNAALLFDPKNPEQMALKIKELYDSPATRNELIRRGHERALRWTAAEYVERMFHIIDDFEPMRRCWE